MNECRKSVGAFPEKAVEHLKDKAYLSAEG